MLFTAEYKLGVFMTNRNHDFICRFHGTFLLTDIRTQLIIPASVNLTPAMAKVLASKAAVEAILFRF